MRVVITGATGYLGARLCRNLTASGVKVIGVYRTLDPNYASWQSQLFASIQGDIRDDAVIQQIAQSGAHAVIHLVSLDHRASESDPKLVNEVNVLPTWQLLDQCQKSGIEKFIYFSTMQVYGRIPNVVIDEEYPLATVNNYGLTHQLSEQIAAHFNRNTSMNVISVRLSNSYGVPVFHDNNCWWLAINDLCKSAVEKKEIRLLSDGSPLRDFIHGNDVSNAVGTLLRAAPKVDKNVYHVSSGKTSSIMELAILIQQEYKQLFQQEIPIYTPNGIVDTTQLNHPNERYVIQNSKLIALGCTPKVSLQEGVRELFEYLTK